VLITGPCSIWLSIFGSSATEVRPGSGTLGLLLAVTAVVLLMSGQSPIPLGAVVSDPLEVVVSTSFRVVTGVAVLAGCCAGFGFVQQLCAAAGSQLSPSTTIESDSTVSAAIACILLQPNRHPPAIQTDTVKARRTRENLMNRADFISQKSTLKTQKHKDLASVM
jgi:hypothetical protein